MLPSSLLPTAYCLLPVAYCLLPIADCRLPTARFCRCARGFLRYEGTLPKAGGGGDSRGEAAPDPPARGRARRHGAGRLRGKTARRSRCRQHGAFPPAARQGVA
ncbi:MAG: hypothetical protein F9K43_14295, partial [Bauldia sp.]